MCRLAAFPPNFPRRQALEILLEMEGKNTDGVGSAYVQDGKFMVKKWPTSLSKILEHRTTGFLDHMPYATGWTIAHLRAASHGCNKRDNTHPFIIDNTWAFAHNGVFSEHKLVRLALSKSVDFKGETDTEAAGHLFSIVGARKFCEEVSTSGVFLGLRRDGNLYVVKTSGSLAGSVLNEEKQVLLASELEYQKYPNKQECSIGWYYFSKNGQLLRHKAKALSSYNSGYGGYYGNRDFSEY